MKPSLPRGLWAVASELSLHEADAWMRGAEGAAAWTLRRPAGGDRDALACLRQLRERAAWLAVHGRSDLALLGAADGLIAGAQSLPWGYLAERLRDRQAALSQFGAQPSIQLGAAVHDAHQVEAAGRAQASFLVLGPIWQTPSKRGILEPQGCDRLRALVAQGLPVLAIGGIDRPERVQQAHAAGAHGVMVLRAAQDPQLFAELLCAWRES
jgi:thiamine-phosphate pyrophosphorylase